MFVSMMRYRSHLDEQLNYMKRLNSLREENLRLFEDEEDDNEPSIYDREYVEENIKRNYYMKRGIKYDNS